MTDKIPEVARPNLTFSMEVDGVSYTATLGRCDPPSKVLQVYGPDGKELFYMHFRDGKFCLGGECRYEGDRAHDAEGFDRKSFGKYAEKYSGIISWMASNLPGMDKHACGEMLDLFTLEVDKSKEEKERLKWEEGDCFQASTLIYSHMYLIEIAEIGREEEEDTPDEDAPVLAGGETDTDFSAIGEDFDVQETPYGDRQTPLDEGTRLTVSIGRNVIKTPRPWIISGEVREAWRSLYSLDFTKLGQFYRGFDFRGPEPSPHFMKPVGPDTFADFVKKNETTIRWMEENLDETILKRMADLFNAFYENER